LDVTKFSVMQFVYISDFLTYSQWYHSLSFRSRWVTKFLKPTAASGQIHPHNDTMSPCKYVLTMTGCLRANTSWQWHDVSGQIHPDNDTTSPCKYVLTMTRCLRANTSWQWHDVSVQVRPHNDTISLCKYVLTMTRYLWAWKWSTWRHELEFRLCVSSQVTVVSETAVFLDTLQSLLILRTATLCICLSLIVYSLAFKHHCENFYIFLVISVFLSILFHWFLFVCIFLPITLNYYIFK
jgi:hypothetical protein